jgi:hypothetical protein
MENKRGVTTLGLIVIIFLAFFILIILGVMSYGIGVADRSLSSLDLTIGNTTWNETYQEQMHSGMESLRTTGPQIMSIGMFFGMILCLLLVGINTKTKSNLWIMLDIGIIIIAEVVAVIISQTFRNSIMNISPELLTVFSTTLSAGSKFILNLPTIIPTVGVLVIIATYLFKKEEVEEEIDQSLENGGFY